MEHYQRFQILSAARQDLFLPESPVWVSRCQLSRDLESGKRLLQARMVNCSERTVRQVFLRIVCLGANRERLTQLELVPMQRLAVLPGRVFGDDKLVEVPVRGTVFVEVYAQRVRFADDTVWDERDPEAYLAFKAVPVRPEDPHAEILADRARSGGVRNDCYFRAQRGLWVCTCGMPNATRTLRCVRCGADRLWLEKHMDPNLIDAPEPVKAPEPAPAPAPMPAVTVIPAPIRSDPPVQPTIIVQAPPEPAPEEAPPSHAGRNAAIVIAVLLALALGAFCAWKYLKPYLRYQQALRERAAGNYDQAVAILEEIESYRDSLEQIRDTRIRKGMNLMANGKYQDALELFETLEGCDDQIADCLYSLGVTAYNDKDLEAALDYVAKLRQRFPHYDKTELLAKYCYYSLGNQLMKSAEDLLDTEQKRHAYEEAQVYFTQAGDYEDSAERNLDCSYRIAGTYRDEGDLVTAVGAYAGLGDYADAASQRLACMFDYAQTAMALGELDDTFHAYLNELVSEDYPGAQEMIDRLNGVGFHFQVQITDSDGTPLPEASDLTQVSISYSVELQDEDGAVLVLVRYTLPDGTVGRALLNADRSASGIRGWSPFPTACSVDGTVVLDFYDAARGENEDALIDTVRFQYKQPSPEEDPSADGTHTDPTGEASPGTGRGG